MIPKSFQIAGLNIAVNIDNGLYNKRKIVGEARYPSEEIVIDPTLQNVASIEQSFYHEKIHWILYVMNEDQLRTNEKFVDLFAHLLFQMDNSQKVFYTNEELGKCRPTE